MPIINHTLSKKDQWELTTRNVGKKAALRINGDVVLAQIIREPIAGPIQISGVNWTEETVKSISVQACGAKVELIIPYTE